MGLPTDIAYTNRTLARQHHVDLCGRMHCKYWWHTTCNTLVLQH
jgi:hypothetical protein